MTDIFTRFKEDLQLKGLAQRTIEMYVRAVRQISTHYQKSPELISDEEIRQFFLYNKNERGWSRVASTISLCGIKYFHTLTLQREWTSLKFVRPPKEKILPVILPVFRLRFVKPKWPPVFTKGFLATKKRADLKFIKERIGIRISCKKRSYPEKPQKVMACPDCGQVLLFICEIPKLRGPP